MTADEGSIIGGATRGAAAPAWIVGIDLSGPANSAGTAMASFRVQEPHLSLADSRTGVADETIFRAVSELTSVGAIVVGLDAPLSYRSGGGDRPGDSPPPLPAFYLFPHSRSALPVVEVASSDPRPVLGEVHQMKCASVPFSCTRRVPPMGVSGVFGLSRGTKYQ